MKTPHCGSLCFLTCPGIVNQISLCNFISVRGCRTKQWDPAGTQFIMNCYHYSFRGMRGWSLSKHAVMLADRSPNNLKSPEE